MTKKKEAQSPASPIKKVQKKVSKTRPGMGAPSLEYTDEMGDYICELIATHETSLEDLCRQHPEIPSHDTIYKWRLKNSHFAEMFLHAKREQTFLITAECLRIADDDSRDMYVDKDGSLKPNATAVARDAQRIKARQWQAARLLPRVFGDKPSEDLAAQNAQLVESVALLQAKLAATQELNKAHEKEY